MAKYELNAQQTAMRRRLDIPVFVAAVLTIPVMIIEVSDLSAAWKAAAVVANWFIWLAFVIDLVAMTSVADEKVGYIKSAWLDVLIVVTSFPPLTTLGVLRLARLGRLGPVLRIFRLARLAAVITRGSSAARDVFGKRGFAYVAVVTFFIVIGFAVAATLIDPDIETIGDGLWWSVVTITTVGYGDLTPSSFSGRLAASVLMFVGIGVVGVVTGLVAAVMLDESEENRQIQERLGRIEGLLNQLTNESELIPHDGDADLG